MKFQTDVFTLYDGFNKVLKVLPRGISLPVLEKLYIETTKDQKIKMIAYNFESVIVVEIEGSVIEEGKALINQETIKLINKIKTNDLVIFNDGKITVKNKEIEYYNNNDPEEYPEVDFSNECNIIAFSTTEKELSELLNVKYAGSKDEARPLFISVVINKDYFFSCDNYRIARKKIPFKNSITDEYILSLKSIETLDKLLNLNKKQNKKVELYVPENKECLFVMFIIDNSIKFFVRRLDGKYIDVNKIWVNEFKGSITVKKEQLLNELNFVKDIAGNKQILFNQNSNRNEIYLTVSKSSKEKYHLPKSNIKNVNIKLDCITEGKFNEFILDYKYVCDAVNNVKNDNVTFNLAGLYQPVIIGNEDFILPIKDVD